MEVIYTKGKSEIIICLWKEVFLDEPSNNWLWCIKNCAIYYEKMKMNTSQPLLSISFKSIWETKIKDKIVNRRTIKQILN